MKKAAAIIAMYYFIYISIIFFMSPFLVSKGITQVQMGYLSSISIYLLVGLIFLWGYLSDKFFKAKNLILGNLIISALLIVVVTYATSISVLMVAYLILFSSFMSIAVLLDGVIIKTIAAKHMTIVRSMGSVGAAIGYFVNSYIIGSYDLAILLLFNVCLIVIMIVLTCFLVESKTIATKYYYKDLFKSKLLLKLFAISFLTYGVLAADDPFTYTYNVDFVGISSFTNGIVGFLSIFIEAIIMIFFYKIYQKIDSKKLLFIAAITLAIIFLSKSFLYEYSYIIILGNIAIGIFTGIFIPLVLVLINRYTATNLKASALSFYLICVKLGGAFLVFISTYIYSITDFLPSIYLLHFSVIIIALLVISTITQKDLDV